MKKFFRKSMLVLSFLGLLTFVAPKQLKADSQQPPCQTVVICCGVDDCHYCYVCNVSDLVEAYAVICGIHIED